MHRRYRMAIVLAGFVFTRGASSWGGPPNNDVSDGNGNTASGTGALSGNTTGFGNTASGAFALYSNTTGADNLALGYNAGSQLRSGNSNIYLGSPAGTATESNTMRLGQNQTHTFIAGITGSAPLTSGVPVLINPGTGRLSTVVSSARYKRDIHEMREGSQGLYQLRPVTFRYKHDPQGQKQYGLIADCVRIRPNWKQSPAVASLPVLSRLLPRKSGGCGYELCAGAAVAQAI